MSDETTLPDLSEDSPPSDSPPPSTVAELIRTGAHAGSYDGLGTVAPSETQEPSTTTTTSDGTSSLGGEIGPIPDPNESGLNDTVSDPTASGTSWTEPIEGPIVLDEAVEDETRDGILLRQLRAWSEDQPGSYARTISFHDPGDNVSTTIYYQNYQPFLIEITDNESDVVLISAQALGHITVLAQQFAHVEPTGPGRMLAQRSY